MSRLISPEKRRAWRLWIVLVMPFVFVTLFAREQVGFAPILLGTLALLVIVLSYQRWINVDCH